MITLDQHIENILDQIEKRIRILDMENPHKLYIDE